MREKTHCDPRRPVIQNGQFAVIDRGQSPASEHKYAGVDIELRNFSSRAPADFTVSIGTPGDKAGRLQAKGRFGPLHPQALAQSPINARLEMGEVDLSSLEGLFGLRSPRAGRISLNAEVKGQLSEGIQSEGDIKIEGLKLAEGAEPANNPVQCAYKLLISSEGSSNYALQITSAELKLGESRLGISGRITGLATEPAIDLRIKGDQVALDGLLEIARAIGMGLPAGTTVAGRALIDGHVSGLLKSPALTGRSEIQNLKLQDSRLSEAVHISDLRLSLDQADQGRLAIGRIVYDRLEVTELQSRVTLSGQTPGLNPLSFNVCDGRYQGRLVIDQVPGSSTIALSGEFSGVDVNRFLSTTSSLKNLIYGRASGTLNLRGRGKQFDARSITGPGRLAVNDGRITSFDLAKQIEILGKLTGLPTGGAGTDFRLLSTDFRFDGGRLSTENMRLEMNDIGVGGQGVFQLGESLIANHDLLAKLSPALTRRVVPGSNILAAATTFFMDENMLSVPLRMSGPISQPSFSLNTAAIQKRLTDQLVRQPDRTVKGILDLFKGKPNPDEKSKRP